MTEPASTETLIGNDFHFQIRSGSSPTFVWTDVCAVVDPGSIGEEKAQIDVTSLCDKGHVYRGGLPDGASIPLKCNFLRGDTALQTLYQLYKTNTTGNFRLNVDGVSPEEFFGFNASITAWSLAVPSNDKVQITFTLKVNGEVDWSYPT